MSSLKDDSRRLLRCTLGNGGRDSCDPRGEGGRNLMVRQLIRDAWWSGNLLEMRRWRWACRPAATFSQVLLASPSSEMVNPHKPQCWPPVPVQSTLKVFGLININYAPVCIETVSCHMTKGILHSCTFNGQNFIAV